LVQVVQVQQFPMFKVPMEVIRSLALLLHPLAVAAAVLVTFQAQ
jgi:hypothetical protein